MSKLTNGPNWTTQHVILTDLDTDVRIKLTMWYEKCGSRQAHHKDFQVIVENVVIDE